MGLESIYSFMIKRMMAVADEIFDSVKDSIIEYEKEIERLKQENCSLRSRDCSCAETCHGQYHIHYYKPIINKNCIPSIITFLKRGIQCIRLTILKSYSYREKITMVLQCLVMKNGDAII